MSEHAEEPQDFWNKMPNEIRLMVFKKLDLETSVAVRAIGKIDKELIQTFVRHQASILIRYFKPYVSGSKTEIVVELKDMIDENSFLQWILSSYVSRHIVIVHRNSREEVLYTGRYRGSLPEKAFQLVRRLCSDPLLEVKKIEFNMPRFNGNLSHGIVCPGLEKIVMRECTGRGNLVKNVILNYSFRNSSIDFFGFDPSFRRLRIDTLMLSRPVYFEDYTKFEREYTAAFPESYEVTSFEDAFTRYRQFMNNNRIFVPINDDHGVRERIELDATVNKTMYVRAAYGKDPVRYLQLTDRKYARKIKEMRKLCNALPLENGEIAMLWLYIFQRLECYGSRGREFEQNFLFYGLEFKIRLRIGRWECIKMLRRIDNMMVS